MNLITLVSLVALATTCSALPQENLQRKALEYNKMIYSDKNSQLWCVYQNSDKLLALEQCFKGKIWTAFKYKNSVFSESAGSFLSLKGTHLQLSSRPSNWTWTAKSFISSNSKSGCVTRNSNLLTYTAGTKTQVANWFKQGKCLNFELRFLQPS